MKSWLRIADAIDAATSAVAGIVKWSLLANVLLVAGNAVSRKLFSATSADIYNLQWHVFAAVVLLMAAYTLKRNEHVRVDVLSQHLGERGMAWLDLAGILAVLLPLCIAVAWVTVPQVLHAISTGEVRVTEEGTTGFPAWLIKGFIPAGFLLLGLQGVAEAIRCVACLRGYASRPVHRQALIESAEPGT